jgi:Outer membrane protein beta-barrel domain
VIGRRLASLLLFASAFPLHPQALPTASRAGDVRLGGGFSMGTTGYTQDTFRGFFVYGDFDFSRHLGVEAEFHQIDTPNGDQSYQRTYEIGGRYFRSYGPLVPYVKALVGRGDFNYPFGQVNLPYPVFAAGAGADLKLGKYLQLRGDYEFQKWTSFPNGGLTPQLVSFGIAYHFAGKPRYK